MIFLKYRSLLLLLFSIALERFAYYFVSFVLLYFMITTHELGGIAFPQDKALKIASIFSIGILCGPIVLAPVIDKFLGLYKASLYGGICLVISYFFTALSMFLFPNFILLALIFCVVGCSLIKPALFVLVGKLYPNHHLNQDISYIVFLLIGSSASFISAFLASKFLYSTFYYKYMFLFSSILMCCYTGVVYFLNKKNKDLFLKDKNYQKSLSIFLVTLIYVLCLLMGLNGAMFNRVISFSTSLTYWGVIFLISATLLILWKNLENQRKTIRYFYIVGWFFIFFFLINIFVKNFGIISSYIPAVFSSIDTLFNFLIFPLFLSFLFRYSNKNYLATFQASAFFIFSGSSLVAKKLFEKLNLSTDQTLWLLSFSVFVAMCLLIVLFIKLKKLSEQELLEKNS
ncbi:MAG: hypothetical protein DCC88_04345 [Spirobacillus cienkowskii]|uniref:MFS transporter n=1 Tax=Spirobacillus cienkowskii TaxID=495820 RepID=A0A369KPJ1_9BACT|nr:MAG: hypothetical protein DCC88_04345 [Spirobacillus cienkowskii]